MEKYTLYTLIQKTKKDFYWFYSIRKQDEREEIMAFNSFEQMVKKRAHLVYLK